MEHAHGHGEADADLELALKLHRELNAVPRRQRAPPRTQAASAALKTLSKKHQHASESSSSSGSETERQPGSGEKRRRGGGGGAPSDNDSGSKRRRSDKGAGGDKGSGRGKPRAMGRRPQHVAAAAEVRRKAARAGSGDSQARTHVKCFFAGLQHGAWLAADALASRASLAAAVSRAFADDGVACSSEAATIVLVGADQQSAEFPGAVAAAAAGRDDKWTAAAKGAVRVYVR